MRSMQRDLTLLYWVLLLIGLTACAPSQNLRGPRLVSDVSLTLTAPPNTAPDAAQTPMIAEVPPVLPLPTLPADVLVVTPTLPPSKTPTQTPTFTPTPTQTLTPTITTTATATALALPTSVISPIIEIVAVPNNQICDTNWFFLQPRPPSCPMNVPNATNGVYQTFQNGVMVWVRSQDAIYVMYNDTGFPRWQVYRDYFEEGMPETSPEYDNPPEGLYQPRRGFGMLWRSNAAVRDRVGWATMRDEMPYSVQVQTARDGSIYISTPFQGVFGLLPSGTGWNLFNTTPAINNAVFPTQVFVPLPTVFGN